MSSANRVGIQGFYSGDFEGDVSITIYRFSSSEAASSTLDEAASFAEDRSGSTVSQQNGEVHWLTHTESEMSVFMWRKDVWLFIVYAPTETLRNQAVEDLSY
jgi:hypothetical protein